MESLSSSGLLEAQVQPSFLERVQAAVALIDSGSLSQGLACLDADWLHSPPEIAGLAGAYLLQNGLASKAILPLQNACLGLPEDPAHAVNLGRCLNLLGRAEDALPHLQRGLGLLDPAERPGDHNLALRSLAEALQQLGRTDEALALLPADADDDKLVCARAALLASSGQHDQAAVLLAESLQARPEAEPLRLMAAELAEVRGRTGEAIALLQQGLEKDPDNLALLLQLGACRT